VKGATRALKLKDGRPMTNQDRLWSGREVVTKARERPNWEERPCTDRSSIREGLGAEACLASRDARRTLRLRTNADLCPPFGIRKSRRPGIQPSLIACRLRLQHRQERPTSSHQIHAFVLRPVIYESMHLQSALLLRLDNVWPCKQYLCLRPDV